MKQRSRKFAAFAMAAVMAVVFPVSAWAEELAHGDEKTGVGEVEGSVKQDIYQVVLPTVTEDMFNFIIDYFKNFGFIINNGNIVQNFSSFTKCLYIIHEQ